MSPPNLILASLAYFLVSWALSVEAQPGSCLVSSFSDVADAVASCTDILISGIEVPAGTTLDLDLQDGTLVTFEGRITFGYAEWDGPLIHIKGNEVTVQGTTVYFLGSWAWSVEAQPGNCFVTSFSEVADAVESCIDIVISDIEVPPKTTLDLDLQNGTILVLQGRITFGYAEWDGPLIHIKGNAIVVQGGPGFSFDGEGAKYWDGLGGNGGKSKPKFIYITATGGSVFNDIKLVNCPKHCVTLVDSNGVTLNNWDIDSSDGDTQGGHNTDGFDIHTSSNVVIQHAVVRNQDDCVAVNQGSNMTFSGFWCYGSHGLSLSVGMSKTDPSENIVRNITFLNSTVANSRNGIHVKTHMDGTTGSVDDVTYRNIVLSGITYYGINIQEDYANGSDTGKPMGNIPIHNLVLSNIRGTMSGKNSVPVYILCGSGGCADWEFDTISITGNQLSSSCNFTPEGFSC